jgi:ribosomal protein S18 acetylase RimI-like enzyme
MTFTSEETWRRADEVVDHLRGPRLWVPRRDYPDFDEWLEKAWRQLRSEEKRALLALVDGRVAAAVVYQRHADDPSVLEVKNVSVRPDWRGRLVASFLLRNAEAEGVRDFGSREAVVDAKAGNLGVRAYLIRNGYRPAEVQDLYGLGAGPDVLYRKRVAAAGDRAISSP